MKTICTYPLFIVSYIKVKTNSKKKKKIIIYKLSLPLIVTKIIMWTKKKKVVYGWLKSNISHFYFK